MTPEEAIRILSSKTSRAAVRQIRYYTGFDKDKVIEQIQEAMDMGAVALKRFMPMYPYAESDGYADGYPVWEYSCPECGCEFDEDRVCYCPDCGQKIVWADDVMEVEDETMA